MKIQKEITLHGEKWNNDLFLNQNTCSLFILSLSLAYNMFAKVSMIRCRKTNKGPIFFASRSEYALPVYFPHTPCPKKQKKTNNKLDTFRQIYSIFHYATRRHCSVEIHFFFAEKQATGQLLVI